MKYTACALWAGAPWMCPFNMLCTVQSPKRSSLESFPVSLSHRDVPRNVESVVTLPIRET